MYLDFFFDAQCRYIDNLCKQFGLQKRWACSGSKLIDTPIVFLEAFFKKNMILKEKPAEDKKARKIPCRQIQSGLTLAQNLFSQMEKLLYQKVVLYSLSAIGNFSCLLISFTNRFAPDQARTKCHLCPNCLTPR